MKATLLLLSGWLMASCDGGGSMPPPVDNALNKRIDEAVEIIESDTCFLQGDISLCQWADYDVGPARFDMTVSTNEAVLTIDSFDDGFFPQLVRYRNRILGFYRIMGDRIEPQILSVHLPKRLGDVLASFAGPEFIPASTLARVAMAVAPMYGDLGLLYLGHGGVVFGHLVDLVPDQPLVLLDMRDLLDVTPDLCRGIGPDTLALAAARIVSIAESLKQIMTKHNVRFVNASFGSTTPVLAAEWQAKCGMPAPSGEQLRQLLHIYDPLYTLLFDSPGIITAHAAANLGNPADFPFDQLSAQYPNKVRIGFISSLSSGLDEAGRGTVRKTEQFPGDGDADIYLNWNCEALGPCSDPHYQMVGAFGISTATLPVMLSSFINPLGLARLVNLRYANHGDEPMTNGLIQQLKHELTPSLCGTDGVQPCTYQDPILHRELEPYRLGYPNP